MPGSQNTGTTSPGDQRAYAVRVRAVGGGTRKFPVRFYPDSRDQDRLRKNREGVLRIAGENKGVLVIYSGGTIGSAPSDSEDLQSPQVVKDWPELVQHVPPFKEETPYALNFKVDAVAFEKALDSSNMGPTEWAAVAVLLKEYMDKYEGFVIAHGTDTMVYSASALSFMLEHLKKPVILTGAQLSGIGHVRNDAQQNLVTAILIANPSYSHIPPVPEVCIFFGGRLLRGNRAIKIDAEGYAAYDAPNYDDLGAAGAKIVIHENRLRKVKGNQPFEIRDRLDTNVMDVVVFPGIQHTDLLKRVLELPDLKAVVLRTFGAGNTPTDPEFLSQLSVAREKNIVVVNVTQCARGSVEMGLYETSAVLMKYGVVSGGDCTPVAALTKLMVLLGDDRYSREQVVRRVQVDLRGEQSESILVRPMTADSDDATSKGRVELARGSAVARIKTAAALPERDRECRHASLILHSASVIPGSGDRVMLNLYINVSRDEPLNGGHAKKVCSVSRLKLNNGTLVFDVSQALKDYIDVETTNSFTIELASPDGKLRWAGAELALHTPSE